MEFLKEFLQLGQLSSMLWWLPSVSPKYLLHHSILISGPSLMARLRYHNRWYRCWYSCWIFCRSLGTTLENYSRCFVLSFCCEFCVVFTANRKIDSNKLLLVINGFSIGWAVFKFESGNFLWIVRGADLSNCWRNKCCSVNIWGMKKKLD